VKVKARSVAVAIAVVVGAWVLLGLARQVTHIRSVDDAGLLVLYGFEDQTRWAPGFDEAKFARVRPGMLEGEVVSLLGRPLRVVHFEGPDERVLYYSEGPPDTNYWLRLVVVDAVGRVRDVRSEYFAD
jgi:hypothetical protein